MKYLIILSIIIFSCNSQSSTDGNKSKRDELLQVANLHGKWSYKLAVALYTKKHSPCDNIDFDTIDLMADSLDKNSKISK